MNTTNSAGDTRTIDCKLCIVGAGIAGINALYVASRFLARDDVVVLIDQNPRSGGMWNAVYDYVRLHQPHPMFTAGDIPWIQGHQPGYLADKGEVLDHFRHCIDELAQRVTLRELYDHTYVSHEEHADGGAGVTVKCNDNRDGGQVIIRAERCIKAFGFRVPQNPPMQFASNDVRSISPDLDGLGGATLAADDAPVYVIGGGKTGMDTAYALLDRHPEKAVHLVVGPGTVFSCRDKAFPVGLGRWWRGRPTLETFMDVSLKFDGDNELAAFDYFRRNFTVSVNDRCSQFVFGVMSEHENELIRSRSREVIMDYLVDVEDSAEGPCMRFRSGATRVVPRGTWIVNCSGYIMREHFPYEPFISPGGAVASIQPRSAIHFLTSFAAYFLINLFFLDQLRELPLYEVDYQGLTAANKQVMPFVAMSHAMYNTGLILNAVPQRVMAECGLDFDRWYPFPRRLLSYARLRRDYDNKARHWQHSLDRARERFGVRCGPLVKAA